jgi:flagellar basal body-associated protein FliL
MKNPKILIPIVLLLVLGGVYKFVLAKPAEAAPEPKVHGNVYVLPKEFVVNLANERLARFNVALLLAADYVPGGAGGGHGAPPAAPPEGFGADPQEGLLRDIVVDEVTGREAAELQDRKQRNRLKEEILEEMKRNTDVEVEHVLFTDLAVQ